MCDTMERTYSKSRRSRGWLIAYCVLPSAARRSESNRMRVAARVGTQSAIQVFVGDVFSCYFRFPIPGSVPGRLHGFSWTTPDDECPDIIQYGAVSGGV